MEDSRSDDERPEQKEEDPGATRRDDTAGQDTQGPRESESREGSSTSDAAARRKSDETVSETEIPISRRSVEIRTENCDMWIRSTTSVLPGDDTKQEGREANQTARNSGQNSEQNTEIIDTQQLPTPRAPPSTPVQPPKGCLGGCKCTIM
ncbi:unnamed protein product [Caenorhabditis brenneri]